MARRAVVVGGGVIGISCAHYLGRSGFDVTVVDREQVGAGCSYANCGLIVPSHSQPLPRPGIVREGLGYLTKRDSPFAIRPRPELAPWLLSFLRACDADAYRRGSERLVALSLASLDLFDDLVRRGEAEFGFRRGPLIHVAVSEPGLRRVPAEADELEGLGITVRRLARDDLLGLEPALSPSVLGGIVIEDQAWGDPFSFVRSLAQGLRRSGADIIEGTPVRRILMRNGRAVGIETSGPEERIEADLVVLAAGAWAPSLAAPLGVRIPIQPAAGYSCTISAPSGGPRFPVVVTERRVVLTPLADRLRFGGTLELSGFRTSPDPRRYRAVVRSAQEVLASDARLSHEQPWSGFRPLTSDGLPAIGWAPQVEGLMIAAGHGMLGFTQAPVTGNLVADLANGRIPPIPLEPFRPDRFSRRGRILRP